LDPTEASHPLYCRPKLHKFRLFLGPYSNIFHPIWLRFSSKDAELNYLSEKKWYCTRGPRYCGIIGRFMKKKLFFELFSIIPCDKKRFCPEIACIKYKIKFYFRTYLNIIHGPLNELLRDQKTRFFYFFNKC
jgi:hypothetical protein